MRLLLEFRHLPPGLSPHAPAFAASAPVPVPAQPVVVLQRAASPHPQPKPVPAFNMTDRAASPPSDNGQQPPAPSTRPALTTSKPAPTSTPTPPTNHPLLAVARHSGHELPFVTPSTYLHQRASTATATPNNLASAAAPHVSSHSRTIPPPALILAPETPPPMTPLDRDQVQGLVSRTTPRLLCWISDLWTETLSPSSSLPPHTCAVRRKGSTILPASPAASPTSASRSLLTCLVRRTSCAVHMGAGYPLGRVTAHESRGCDISESWRVLGPFWMVARAMS